jgi:hypothetical protein
MKEYLPYIFAGLGVALILISLVLRNGTPETSTVITNLASVFMIIAGVICMIGGLVTYFLRDDPEIW